MKKRITSLFITTVMLLSFTPVLPTKAVILANPMKIGDYLQMGKYYDEPILWRCVDIDENGTLMLADKIITVKPFDAAGNHKNLDGTVQADNMYDYRTKYGSNLWETSTIRSWLNSSEAANEVKWLGGCPPTADMICSRYNDYADEKGFLAEGNFTVSEQNAIKSVAQKSLLNSVDVNLKTSGTEPFEYSSAIATILPNYDTAYSDVVTDKMFILDVKQLNKVCLNGSILGTSYWIGELSQKAIDNSEGTIAPGIRWYSWTRTPCAESNYPDDVRCLGASGYVYDNSAYANEVGVRPAFYINSSSQSFKSGNGSTGTPYIIDGTGSSTDNTNPDLNKDGVIDSNDLAVLKTNILSKSSNVMYDVNNDGKVNILDYIALSKMFVKTPLTDSTNITSAFTDENFKNEVYKLIGKNGPVPILYSDVKNIKNINLTSKDISSLNGVEYFTSLTSLYCGNNKLITLDINKNTALKTLACNSNKLATLDVSKNTLLNYLDCGNNLITTLDLSENTALTFLDCQKNILPSLNVVNNTKLTYLSCADNKLTTLDVSKNSLLTYLNCKNNILTTLNISKNISLSFLNCSYNNITTLSSIKNTWYTDFYKTQYTDTTKTTTTNTLVIIIRN